MPFSRLEELQSVRAEISVVYAQLHKFIRQLIRAKADYQMTRTVEIQLKILPPLHENLQALQKREYRLMTKAELKERSKNSKRVQLVFTFELPVFKRS